MDVDEGLLEQMSHLGFSQYEARAYCALLRHAPNNGHEVSKSAGIPPSKIYETLQKLHQKGAVLIYHSEPVLYAPIPAQDLLARLRQQAETTFQVVEHRLSHLSHRADTSLTWSLSGNEHIMDAFLRIIDRTQKRVFAALWDEELAVLAEPLREAHRRGVELQIAVYGTLDLGVPSTYDLRLCGISAQDRLAGRRLAVLIRDNEETVVAELSGRRSDQGILTQNRVVSLLATEYVKEEIMGRCLINELGEERYLSLRRERPALLSMLKPEVE